jgi:SAM-dependent methyltransferase
VTDDPSESYFATRLAPDPARAAVWKHLAAYLQQWIPRDGAVLDLAAGYADFAGAVVARRRVALDINPALPELVPAGVEAIVGDATDLGRFATGEFDTVFASNFLEHLEHEAVDRCLAEIRRVLRPGGRLLLVQPNFRLAPGAYFDDYTHRTIFTDRSLADLLVARGFSLVRVEPRFLPLTLKSRLKSGHRLVPLYLRLPYRPLAGQMLHVAER